MIPFIFYSSGLWGGKNFADFKDKFEISEISKSFNGENSVITFAIKNNTKYKWNNISYRIIYRDSNNQIVKVDNDSTYSWIVDANSNGYISHEIKNIVGSAKLYFEIVDLKTSRF